jgi:hypothetical protein
MKNDPLSRLKQHSGLPMAGGEVPKDTLAEFVFQATRDGPHPDLGTITEDIIGCLDTLNRQVNQHFEDTAHRQEIPSSLVYAASGMVLMCLEKALAFRRAADKAVLADDLLMAAWRIQCAWDALVAGDIEDLREHVKLEEEARFG